MSCQLCILASGSSGNCSILRTPAGCIMIDCGIGPRTFDQRLEGTGVAASDIRAVVLTHLDADHFKPTWLRTVARRWMRLYCHRSLVRPILAHDRRHREVTPEFAGLLRPFAADAFEPLPGVCFRPLRLAHDEAGSHGFLIEGFGCRLGYASDLGRVTDELIDLFRELDLLALESNYDPHLQRTSGRPWFLQRRIMGGRGHLSNRECFEAIVRILDRDGPAGRLPQHIVLLHRSRQCNCPTIIRDLFTTDPRIARRLVLAEPYRRTDWLCIEPTNAPHFAPDLFSALTA